MDLLTRWFLHSLRYEIKCASSRRGLHERISPQLFSLFSIIKSLLDGAAAMNQKYWWGIALSPLSVYFSLHSHGLQEDRGPWFPFLFHHNPATRTSPRIPFRSQYRIPCQAFGKSRFQIAVKSRIPSRIFAFSRISHCMSARGGGGRFSPATLIHRKVKEK